MISEEKAMEKTIAVMLKISEINCPNCGAQEIHPDEDKLLIRGCKVCIDDKWLSQCLVCADHYDNNLNLTPDNYNPELG